MLFNDVIGQDTLKLELKKSHEQGRVAHSQLFISPEGSGGLPLSIAFARMVIENNLSSETTSYKLSDNNFICVATKEEEEDKRRGATRWTKRRTRQTRCRLKI